MFCMQLRKDMGSNRNLVAIFSIKNKLLVHIAM